MAGATRIAPDALALVGEPRVLRARSLPGHTVMRAVICNRSETPVDLHVDRIDVVGPHRRPAAQFDTAHSKHAHLEPGETIGLTVSWRGEEDAELRYAGVPLTPRPGRF